MPTQEKIDRVADLQDKLERCSIAVTTNYTGITVNEMTELRRQMRVAGVEFTVVKNTLMNLASEAAKKPQVKEIVQGPTAVALGYDDPLNVAKAVSDYIRSARSVLTIRGAVLGDGPVMQAAEVIRLAGLPPKPQLLAMLLDQLQAPIQGLASVLNGPLQNLEGLFQARIRQIEAAGPTETGMAGDSGESEANNEAADAGEAPDTNDSGETQDGGDEEANETPDTSDLGETQDGGDEESHETPDTCEASETGDSGETSE